MLKTINIYPNYVIKSQRGYTLNRTPDCSTIYCYYQKIIKIVLLLVSVPAGTGLAVRDCNSKLSDPYTAQRVPPRLIEALGLGF